MIRLDTVNRSLQLYLGGATTTNPLQIVVCYSDQTSTSYLGATQLSNSNGTTAVTICSAPAVSTTRDIDMLSVLNTDTVAANVTIQVMDTSTPYQLIYVQLSAQDKLTYTHGSGWQIVTGQGNVKYSVQSVPGVTSFNSRTGVVTLTSSDVTTALTYTPAPQTSGTSLLYGNGSGGFSNVTIGSGVTFSGGTLSATGTGTVTSVGLSMPTGFSVSGSPVTSSGTLAVTTSLSGIIKGTGTGFTTATSGTDYAPATSGTSILYGNGSGGFSNVTIGSNLTFTGGTLSAAAGMVYPGAGIPNSTGSAWGTSYSTTGSGTVVALATSPTLVTPILGTPQSGNFSTGTFTWPTFNQNTTGTAANITATSNSTLTTLSALSLPGSQVTGNISGNAANVTGTVAVGNGGTGLTSLTANYIPYGNGTSAFNSSSQLQYNGTYLLVGAASALGGLTNPVAAFTGNPGTTNYVQTYVYNAQNGISSSADLVAYSSNSTDAHGWADLGFTSPTYADPVYTCTGPNEAYLFGSALNSSYTGNLVYATDSTGSANAHQWYVGGFTQAKSAWKMQLTSSGLQAVALDNTPIGATTASTGKFTTLESTGTATLGDASTTYIQVVGDASYPSIKAAGGTNTPLVLQPLGTGALQAQKTDSTATGGNARGANAVDWQTSRSSASQVASAQNSVIGGGASNTASGAYSFVGSGIGNQASSNYTFVGNGNANIVNLPYSGIVTGVSNTAGGYYNFIGGGYTNSGTSSSAVTTQATTTVTSGSTAVTLSGSNASIKVGQYITGTGISNQTYVAAISGTSLTLSQNANASGSPTLSFYTPHGVVVGGGNNQATGSYSAIVGGGDAGTASNRNLASGDWSFVGGGVGNQATANGAFVGGGGIYLGSVSGNTATGLFSAVVGGINNQASGQGSFIGSGYTNYATGNYSIVNGFYGNTRYIDSVLIQSSRGGSQGSSQIGFYPLSVITTTATPAVMVSNTSAAGTTNQVILPNNSAYSFRATIIGGVTGGGNTASWVLQGAIKRGASASATSIVSAVTSILLAQDSGASTWTVSATADTTNGGLAITVTGQASTTIRWVCKVETTEMTY